MLVLTQQLAYGMAPQGSSFHVSAGANSEDASIFKPLGERGEYC